MDNHYNGELLLEDYYKFQKENRRLKSEISKLKKQLKDIPDGVVIKNLKIKVKLLEGLLSFANMPKKKKMEAIDKTVKHIMSLTKYKNKHQII